MDERNESKILVVDDEGRIGGVLRMQVEGEKYVIEEGEKGEEGIKMGLG